MIGLDLHRARAGAARAVASRSRCSWAARSPDGTRSRTPPRAPSSCRDARRPGRPLPQRRLYSPRELYDTPALRRLARRPRLRLVARSGPTPDDALAQALHDHAIDDGARRRGSRAASIVGVMGGHAARARQPRRTPTPPASATASAAALTVATGGGPGAMEAANLGAFVAGRPATVLDEALASLAAVPSFRPDVGAWARRRVRGGRRRLADGARVARHPDLALRPRAAQPVRHRDRQVLQQRRRARRCCSRSATPGIVFLPGAGGTVQEVFQDACENYYADESVGRADGAGRRARTGPRSCRPGRCSRRSRAAARWSRTCTSSTRVEEAVALVTG